MKDFVKASVPVFIGVVFGHFVFKLLGIYATFFYKNFGDIGLYLSVGVPLIIIGSIINYHIQKNFKK